MRSENPAGANRRRLRALLVNTNVLNTMGKKSLMGFRQETRETISHFNTVLTGFRTEDGLKGMP